ncbi:Mov34/MPN/PAD-1 family protein [Gorillibacterium sp. sgz5001074]|uniref:Mov34/MPN/PAD-1 family protein n=1 Tax=Gorillibacterium sp. sgz5001074 TaxID=3446695 RepID=UPI003F66EC44
MTDRPETVCIPQALAEELMEYCLICRPLEACGILYGTCCPTSHEIQVNRFRPIPNHAPLPESQFAFPPEIWVEASMAALTPSPGEDQLVGIFHSHPVSPAFPSGEDLRLEWSLATYAIVSLQQKKPSIRCYHPQPGDVWREQKVMIRNG